MATLTITARTTGPPDSAREMSGVTSKIFSGNGVDVSLIAAAVSGKYHVLTGGVVTSGVAGGGVYLSILSDDEEIGREPLLAADTHSHIVPGVYTEPGEALRIKLSGAKVIWGTIEYVTIGPGDYLGLTLGDMAT